MKGSFVSVLVFFLVVLSLVASAEEVQWSPERIISPTGAYEWSSLAVDAFGNNHVGYWDSSLEFVVYQKLDNMGQTIIPRMTISRTSTQRADPAIAVDRNDNVVFSYKDGTSNSIFYKKLDNNGNVVVEQRQVDGGGTLQSRPPVLAVDQEGNAHVLFSKEDIPSQVIEVYYRKMDSNGQPVTPTMMITPEPGVSFFPRAKADSDGNIHVIYMNYVSGSYNQINYKKLDNNGRELVPATTIFASASTAIAKLAVDRQGNVHILLKNYNETESTYQVIYIKLDNNGRTIIEGMRLDTTPRVGRSFISIATDLLGNAHTVWAESSISTPNQYRIHYTKIDNQGRIVIQDAPISAPVNVVTGDGYVDIAADLYGYTHVTFTRSYSINYMRSLPPANIAMETPACMGYTATFNIRSSPSTPYILAASFGPSPGIPLSDGRTIPLNPDALFYLSVGGNLFQNNIGLTDTQGFAQVRMRVPSDAPEGLILYVAFVTYNPLLPWPSTITAISPAIRVRLPVR